MKRIIYAAHIKYIKHNSKLELPIHHTLWPKTNWFTVLGFTGLYLYMGYIFYVIS